MATIYVGPSSAGAADGTSWANRYGSLNAAEDRPVAAGDEVVVGPGVYRGTLTIDVSGSAGSPITYTADVTGARTDGVGGIVRISGSNDDINPANANCITATARNYRTFRGFTFDLTSSHQITLLTSSDNWIVEDCSFFSGPTAAIRILLGTNHIVRRCFFVGGQNAQACFIFIHTSLQDNSNNLVENCFFMPQVGAVAVRTDRVGGVTVRNCTIVGGAGGFRVGVALTSGQTMIVNNCIILNTDTAFRGTVAGEIVENYNTLFGNITDRLSTNTGANSLTYPANFLAPVLVSGFIFPYQFGQLSEWSQVRAIAGTGMSSTGFYGISRPATDSKKSWGSHQFVDVSRETTTKRTGVASLKLADAARHQMFVPTTAVSTTFSIYVQWEADYAGTKPQMVVRQPGQADTTDTATGSSGTWEELSITLTPAASPGYVIVELVSNNTATTGNYDVFFDDLVVT